MYPSWKTDRDTLWYVSPLSMRMKSTLGSRSAKARKAAASTAIKTAADTLSKAATRIADAEPPPADAMEQLEDEIDKKILWFEDEAYRLKQKVRRNDGHVVLGLMSVIGPLCGYADNARDYILHHGDDLFDVNHVTRNKIFEAQAHLDHIPDIDAEKRIAAAYAELAAARNKAQAMTNPLQRYHENQVIAHRIETLHAAHAKQLDHDRKMYQAKIDLVSKDDILSALREAVDRHTKLALANGDAKELQAAKAAGEDLKRAEAEYHAKLAEAAGEE